jgi:hypothetical protein
MGVGHGAGIGAEGGDELSAGVGGGMVVIAVYHLMARTHARKIEGPMTKITEEPPSPRRPVGHRLKHPSPFVNNRN